MDPEEIAAVIPIDEDPDLAKKVKNLPKKEEPKKEKPPEIRVTKKPTMVKKVPPAEIQIKIT